MLQTPGASFGGGKGHPSVCLGRGDPSERNGQPPPLWHRANGGPFRGCFQKKTMGRLFMVIPGRRFRNPVPPSAPLVTWVGGRSQCQIQHRRTGAALACHKKRGHGRCNVIQGHEAARDPSSPLRCERSGSRFLSAGPPWPACTCSASASGRSGPCPRPRWTGCRWCCGGSSWTTCSTYTSWGRRCSLLRWGEGFVCPHRAFLLMHLKFPL